MKKFFVTLVVFVGTLAATITTNAQATKYGVFDIDLMVQAMPQYRAVDSLVQLYERDSLQREYDFYQGEFKRLDSTYKADSARKAPKSVLDQILNQRQQIGINLVYWQQISQNRIEQKRGTLAQPIFEKVLPAYKKVLDARKYDLILKPNTFELGSKVENVFIFVAKELKITLPQELGGGQEPQEDEKPAPAKSAAPAAKPAPKKN
jgi:Skp family chaperone for outer membrane proteins